MSIKSGGPKPGHDVKHEPSLRPASVAGATSGDPSPGGRWFLVGVLLLVLLLLGVAIMLFLDDGARSEAPAAPTGTMLASTDTAVVGSPGVDPGGRLL